MAVKNINTVQVGDVITEVWGTRLDVPWVVTSIEESPTFGRTGVRGMTVAFVPATRWLMARSNDNRPIVVADR